jgi:hypothetical protein
MSVLLVWKQVLFCHHILKVATPATTVIRFLEVFRLRIFLIHVCASSINLQEYNFVAGISGSIIGQLLHQLCDLQGAYNVCFQAVLRKSRHGS